MGFLFTTDVNSLSPDSTPVQVGTNETLAFRIEGWESPSDADGTSDTRPTLCINSSWHVAWR
jgi:hypothetical protein